MINQSKICLKIATEQTQKNVKGHEEEEEASRQV